MPTSVAPQRSRSARAASAVLALALAAGLSLSTAGAVEAVPVDDAVNVTSGGIYTNAGYAFAQSFVAGISGDLTSVRFEAQFASDASAPAQLVTMSGSVPSATVIASGAITTSNATQVTYTFPAPAHVTAGTTYAIVLGNASNISVNQNIYASGSLFSSTNGAPWFTETGLDARFTTRVEPDLVNPVTALTASAADRAVNLTWTAPTGGSTPASYLVEYRANGAAAWQTSGSVATTTATVTGLTGGTLYDFRVTAVGTYVSSTPVSTTATPYATATAPQNVVFAAGDETATLSWAAPADAGTNPITKYVVELTSPSGTVASDVTGTTTTLTGLTNGTSYSAQVFAVTADGNGAKSAAVTATPSAFAEAPVLTVTEGNATLDLEWTAPLSDGSAITQYEIELTGPAGTTTSTTLPAVREFAATGLANGETCTSRVRAYNSRGAGAWSALNTSVPRTIPGTPTAFVAMPGTGSAQLNWVAPASNGGATIDSYAIEYREVGAAAWATATALGTATGIELTGLANGVAHEFRIAAVNEAGAGASTGVETATPFAATLTFTKPDGTPLAGERLSRGTKVVLTGTQLPEGATVSFELHSTPVVLGTGVVAADGTVTIAASIPADAAFGSHELVGLVTSQGVTVSTSVAVVVPLIVIPTGDGDLAVTGTDLLTGLNLAALLVLVGGALLMVARRRSIRIA